MTASRPPEIPLSRRAARAHREEILQRASDTPPAPAPATAPGPAADSAADLPATTLPLPILGAADSVPEAAPSSRRAARAAALLSVDIPPVRHARPRPIRRATIAVGLAAGAALLLGSTAAVTAMVADPPAVTDTADDSTEAAGTQRAAAARMSAPLSSIAALPVPQVEQEEPTADICALPEVVEALGAGDDEGVIIAAGGATAFRDAVVGANAPCISLSDPARVWVVVNKARAYTPIDFRPASLVPPDDVRSVEGGSLRPDAASALTHMVAAARAAGVGEIAMESGFRSYSTQQRTYGSQVAARGGAAADQVSARPGFSEHQSGWSADLVPCGEACGTLDELAPSAQGAWLREHSWEFGWIIRYEDGHTPTTGYLGEAWHLRFIGHDLARAYHEGGWHTLEDFFALPPAPDYLG